MSNSANVSAGKPKVSGAVFRAPLGTTLPTSASATLDAAFVELGFVSEDGVTNTNSPETDVVKAWGGETVLVLQTDKTDEWKLTLIEALNPNVLQAVYGEDAVNYSVQNGTVAISASAAQLPDAVYVIDMSLKGGALKRVVIPVGSISEIGDIVYKDDEAIGYELTITALANSSKVTHYEYIVLAANASASISVAPTTATVAKNANTPIVATTVPAGSHVLWGTSDPTVATVDQSGKVTGVAAGSATITASFGGLSATCAVTVTG